jgi:hypothetical protein
MTFDPARHSALARTDWDPDDARAAIAEIVADAEAAFDPETYWPSHPQEDGLPAGMAGLYFGAAGVLWAMDFLKREGAASHGIEIPRLLPGLLNRLRFQFAGFAQMSSVDPNQPSLLMGDPPVLLMMIRAGDEGAADDLFRRMEAGAQLPVLELMWGAAGAMIACRFAAELTGEARWRGPFETMAARLQADLEQTADGPIWTQHLYGHVRRFLGPVHGFAGNVLGVLAGWDWLSEAQRAAVCAAVDAALPARAIRSPEGVNWPPTVDPTDEKRLVQHCHGAPGMVTALACPQLRSAATLPLFEAAGELTWRAGPLAKGSNLCHGTGGNGFAFLKLYALTGETVWRDRARAFAMIAIDQCRAARVEYGRGRYTLWTGDIGLACYLHECLQGSARFPTVDVF